MTDQDDSQDVPVIREDARLQILTEMAARRFHVVSDEDWALIPDATKKSMLEEAGTFIAIVYIGILAIGVKDIAEDGFANERFPDDITTGQVQGIEMSRQFLRDQASLLWENREFEA